MVLGKCIYWLLIFWNSGPKEDVVKGIFSSSSSSYRSFLAFDFVGDFLDFSRQKPKKCVLKSKVNKWRRQVSHVFNVVKESV